MNPMFWGRSHFSSPLQVTWRHVGEREPVCEVTPGFPQVPAERPLAGLSAPEPHLLHLHRGVRTSSGIWYRFWVILSGLAKKFVLFSLCDGSTSA